MKFTVKEQEAGQRLDSLVALHMPELSRSSIQKLCDLDKVVVNTNVQKPSYHVRQKDKVEVLYDKKSADKIEKINIPIIFEDDNTLVLDKPAGVLTHSKGAFNPEATVATFIQPYLEGLDGERAGIVHRLDRNTSGLIITAKNPDSLKWLQKQFGQRKVKKAYIALIEGKIEPEKAVIDMPIERNPKKPQTFRVGAQGKHAQTSYEVMESNNKYTMLKLAPATGRTHQLRVHLKQLGHPILGDTLYGGKSAKRLFLHATSLELTLPDRTRNHFSSPLPKEFEEVFKNG